MPQVFKIGTRERTVRTVLFFATLQCIKLPEITNYIHCNVCSSPKNLFFYIPMYEILAKRSKRV